MLEITPAQTSEHICPYKVIDIRDTDPSFAHSQWEVTSYKSSEDRAASPDRSIYACTMIKLK